MTSHQRHHNHHDNTISTASPSETVTNDDTLAGLSETTPLISPSSPGARRLRSYGNKSTLLPKRRTRARLSRLFNKPQAARFDYYPAAKPGSSSSADAHNAEHEFDGDEEHHSSRVSSPNLTSPTISCQTDTSAAWLALKDIGSPQQPSTPLSSKFNLTLSSPVVLRLENTGSVARDHLASERTFLAYMRTSLAIASSGVALVQLFTVASASPSNTVSPYARKIHTYVRPLGAITVIMGLLVLATGVIRYFTIQAALTKGFFPVARITVGAIAMALTVLVILSFAILVAGKLDSKGVLVF